MFRWAIVADPFCDAYPDAMAALSHRLYLEEVRSGNPDPPRTESLLTGAIHWEAKAVSLSTRDFQKTSRLAGLFLERYGVGRRREDLKASIYWTGRALEINPYSAEKLWDRANLLVMDRRRDEAENDLARAVSMEPNFCRGYDKLAELTKGTDDLEARGWKARAGKCWDAARGRTLEENERWLVVEPEPTPIAGMGRDEDGKPDLPSAFSPSR